MAQQLVTAMVTRTSNFDRRAALADLLEQALAEADALDLGVVAIRISEARDQLIRDMRSAPLSGHE
jgi:hypothetical protein